MRSDILTTMIKYYSRVLYNWGWLAQSTPIVQYTTSYNQSSVMHTTYRSARSSLWRAHHQSQLLNSAVTSLLITKIRVAHADIQDNSSLNSDCSTPVTQIQDYGERKEEKSYPPQTQRIYPTSTKMKHSLYIDPRRLINIPFSPIIESGGAFSYWDRNNETNLNKNESPRFFRLTLLNLID